MTIQDHAGSCTHVHAQERAGGQSLPRPRSESLCPESLDPLPKLGCAMALEELDACEEPDLPTSPGSGVLCSSPALWP